MGQSDVNRVAVSGSSNVNLQERCSGAQQCGTNARRELVVEYAVCPTRTS